MKRVVKAAGVQLAPAPTKEKSLEKAASLVTLAAEKGARIICLPQLFSTPWFPHTIDRQAFTLAESDDGPTLSQIRELARGLEVDTALGREGLFQAGRPRLPCL
jgi:N-carbamoylputrescine amidase